MIRGLIKKILFILFISFLVNTSWGNTPLLDYQRRINYQRMQRRRVLTLRNRAYSIKRRNLYRYRRDNAIRWKITRAKSRRRYWREVRFEQYQREKRIREWKKMKINPNKVGKNEGLNIEEMRLKAMKVKN